MIVIKIELWPGGCKDKAYEIGKMVLINDGNGTPTLGNYHVYLSKQRHKPSKRTLTASWRTKLMGFPRRRLGVYHLIYQALRATVGEGKQ